MNYERIEEERETKKSMKSLQTIQIAIKDKENLTSKKSSGKLQKKKPNMNSNKLTDTKKNQKTIPIDNKTVIDIKNNINKAKSEKTAANDNDNGNINQVTAQDLTGDAPSENYWQLLAESRRVALESTMKENVDLHNKLTELEYENSRLREMVDEAKNLVEVLTEMLEDKENTTVEDKEDTTLEDKEDTSDAPERTDE